MKVFFNIKSNSRERMWDTIHNAPISSIYPTTQNPKGSLKTYSEYKSIKGMIKNWMLTNIPLINKRRIPNIAQDADLIYTWGTIPSDTDKPFIIEMDNPYCLTYYNYKAAQKYKSAIQRHLSRAKALTFMSQTAKAHFLDEYGEEFAAKSFVNYPFIHSNIKHGKKNNDKITFLFVGLTFRLKGGPELLKAFSKIDNSSIELLFVSHTPEDIKKAYASDPRIKFIDPLPREQLLSDIYPLADIFVFPTLYESFGVVLLEALSYGMGIITTNSYATQEMVKHGENGYLIHHPFLQPQKFKDIKATVPIRMHINEFQKHYVKNDFFYFSLYLELQKAIIDAIVHYPFWKKESAALFNDRFSETVWKQNFLNIIN